MILNNLMSKEMISEQKMRVGNWILHKKKERESLHTQLIYYMEKITCPTVFIIEW